MRTSLPFLFALALTQRATERLIEQDFEEETGEIVRSNAEYDGNRPVELGDVARRFRKIDHATWAGPFFTVRQTGEANGLGRSAGYDTETKAHGGTLTAGMSPEDGASVSIVVRTA